MNVAEEGRRLRLAGELVLVTGAAGGIGRAITDLFVCEGAELLATDRPGALDAMVGLPANRTAAAPLDVTVPGNWHEALQYCVARFGRPPSVLVYAAGVMVTGTIDQLGPEDLYRAYDVNVAGVLHGVQAVLPAMRLAGHGSIVILSSAGGSLFGCPGASAYAASKAANAALARSIAIELGPAGIRVNTIAPGGVDTPMSRSTDVVDADSFYKHLPLGRIGQPEDIAHAALFLASRESAWVTGTNLLVDGGMLAGPWGQ